MFVDFFPAPRKRYCTASFPERFAIVFPSARTLHFPCIFPTELLTVNAMKTCCSFIVFLLYGNSSKQLALFFCSFRERTSAEFSKCFHTQLLMVNVKKT